MDDRIFVCRGKSIEQVKAETQDSIVLGFFVMLKYMLRMICFGILCYMKFYIFTLWDIAL